MVQSDRAMAGEGPRAGKPARLLLASRSPRRRLLLTQHGIEHEAEHPGVDDGVLEQGQVSPEAWAAALAYFKAAAGADRAAAVGLVLGADTVCVNEGEVIGQPRDAADAERIISGFESKRHEVMTGVALVWGGPARDVARPAHRSHRRIFVDRSRVTFGAVGRERIGAYVKSGQWAGKAGAYNLAERQEAGWPIECEGDPTSVMGLPMRALKRVLRSLGVPA